MKLPAYAAVVLMAMTGLDAHASGSLAESVHNLSVSGPGPLKSQTEDQICVFCHTPHSGAAQAGLWNRQTTPIGRRYRSSTADAVPSSRSRSSELCLSCHDGTIALGEMLTPPRGNRSGPSDLGGVHLAGRGRFGSDLSNHHPIAVNYDESLRRTDPDLVSPEAAGLPLPAGELHCVSCHDPHVSDHQPFLNLSSDGGELCLACHEHAGRSWDWQSSSHAESEAVPTGGNPWRERKAEWKGRTVADNACMNCHAPHNAASAQRLMTDVEEQTCLRCHDGSVAEKNILHEVRQFNRHPVDAAGFGRHDALRAENPLSMRLHVECEDCHNAHASRGDEPMISFDPGNPLGPDHTVAPFINGTLLGVRGVSISGNQIDEAEYEYEVCFRCHGVPGRSACGNRRCQTAEGLAMSRFDNVYNLRDKFDSGSPTLRSYHPIDDNDPSNDDEVPSLRLDIPLNRTDSRIYCGDCHNGDSSPAAGANGPAGPHGSRYQGLLALSYEVGPRGGSFWYNARLCSKCHDPSVLLSDESFPHRIHVVNNRTPCGTCHDPHGSAAYPHLINFMTTASLGGQDFEINAVEGFSGPRWEDRGRYSGTCYLSCHGVDHAGVSYGSEAEPDEPEVRIE